MINSQKQIDGRVAESTKNIEYIELGGNRVIYT